MGARNRGGTGLSYRPTRLHRLAEFIPWNRFLGSINVQKYGLCVVPFSLIYSKHETGSFNISTIAENKTSGWSSEAESEVPPVVPKECKN
jgi:hypothetical protein